MSLKCFELQHFCDSISTSQLINQHFLLQANAHNIEQKRKHNIYPLIWLP